MSAIVRDPKINAANLARFIYLLFWNKITPENHKLLCVENFISFTGARQVSAIW
jgi:hypothetical protein